jgi:NADH-quinone oxidoreductase subunit H
MKWFSGLAPVFLGLAMVWMALFGPWGARALGHELVQVLDVAPREVELGDRVAILGEGFPAGKTARVTFEGTLHRPGEEPVRDARLVLTALAVASGELRLSFDEAAHSLFCASGPRARHTTFEGSLQVAFAAASAGEPPVVGTLRRVIFDVRPRAGALGAALEREGTQLLAWLGVRAVATASGLLVESVDKRSPGHAAGLALGDVIVSADGLRVASPGDLVPPPGDRFVRVRVRPAAPASDAPESPPELERTVPIEGFRPYRADWLGPSLPILSALLIAALFAAPAAAFPWAVSSEVSPAVARAFARAAMRLRLHLRARDGRFGWLRPTLVAAAADIFPSPGSPALVDALSVLLLSAMPFGQYLVAARLDAGLLFLSSATALAATALVTGWPFWRGIRRAAHVACQHLPGAAAIAGVVVATGSFRMQEIERAQGGWPWDWLAFQSPAGVLGLLLVAACAGIEPDGRRDPSPLRAAIEDGGERLARARRLPPVAAAACRAHRFVLAGLASALFLGGWLVPGLSCAAQQASLVWMSLGAVFFLAKTYAVVVAASLVRSALPQPGLAERTRVAVVWLLPLAGASLVATAAWTSWGPPRTIQVLISGSLVLTAALVVLALLDRLRHAVLTAGNEPRLSPFL